MQEHYIQDLPMERGTLVSIAGGVLFLQEIRNRDPFQRAVPCWQDIRSANDLGERLESMGHDDGQIINVYRRFNRS